MVIARTDARGPAGLDEAIARARRYAEAGADAVFVEAPQSRAEVERIAAEVTGVPLVFNVVTGGLTPVVDDADLERLGFAVAIYPTALIGPAVQGMLDALGVAEEITSPAALFEQVGLSTWAELGKRYG